MLLFNRELSAMEAVKSTPKSLQYLVAFVIAQNTMHNKFSGDVKTLSLENQELIDLLVQTELDPQKALCALSRYKNISVADVAEDLLKMGATVDGLASEATPLICAIKAKSIRMVEFLLEHGANPNNEGRALSWKNKRGRKHSSPRDLGWRFPMHYAVKRTDNKLIALLLNYKAQVNVWIARAAAKQGDEKLFCDIAQIFYTTGSHSDYYLIDQLVKNNLINLVKNLYNIRESAKMSSRVDFYYVSSDSVFRDIPAHTKHAAEYIALLVRPSKKFGDMQRIAFDESYFNKAVYQGNLPLVEFCVNYGARISREHLRTALYCNFLKVFEFLLDKYDMKDSVELYVGPFLRQERYSSKWNPHATRDNSINNYLTIFSDMLPYLNTMSLLQHNRILLRIIEKVGNVNEPTEASIFDVKRKTWTSPKTPLDLALLYYKPLSAKILLEQGGDLSNDFIEKWLVPCKEKKKMNLVMSKLLMVSLISDGVVGVALQQKLRLALDLKVPVVEFAHQELTMSDCEGSAAKWLPAFFNQMEKVPVEGAPEESVYRLTKKSPEDSIYSLMPALHF